MIKGGMETSPLIRMLENKLYVQKTKYKERFYKRKTLAQTWTIAHKKPSKPSAHPTQT